MDRNKKAKQQKLNTEITHIGKWRDFQTVLELHENQDEEPGIIRAFYMGNNLENK